MTDEAKSASDDEERDDANGNDEAGEHVTMCEGEEAGERGEGQEDERKGEGEGG